MKWLLSSLLCMVGLYSQAQAFQVPNDAIDRTQYDTLHIYPSRFEKKDFDTRKKLSQYKGYPIPKDVITQYGIDTLYPAKKYTFTNQFIIDTKSNTFGYIITCEGTSNYDSQIIFAVLNEAGNLIESHTVAYYTSIPATMNETQNAWIFDADKDGDLDLLLMNDLEDFEFPNEYADNITSVRIHYYSFQDGAYYFDSFNGELPIGLKAIR
jgi:hypothetical protein